MPVKAWISIDTAKQLCHQTGHEFEQELKKAAINKDFRPIALRATASFTVHNSLRQFVSRNVVAKIEGSDSALEE